MTSTSRNQLLAPVPAPKISGPAPRSHARQKAAVAPRQDLLATLAEAAEAARPGMLCSLLLLDEDGKRLRHGAAPSLPKFYRDAIDGVEIGEAVGSCGTAAYRGERVIVEDIAAHPYWAEYCDLAGKAGLGACWSEPIFSSSGAVLGSFAMYYRAPRGPDRADLEFIETYALLAASIIEGQRAEKALRQSEKRFRDYAELASDWFWEMGPDLRFTWFSEEDLGKAGSCADSVIGKTRWEMSADGEDSEKWAAHRADLEARRPFRDFFFRVHTEAGELDYRSVSGTPLFDAQGNFAGYHGTARDITEAMRAEEEARERDAYLSQSQAIAGIGSFVWNHIEDRCVYCSEGMARLAGLTVPEYLESRSSTEVCLALSHPDDRARYEGALRAAIENQVPFDIERRVFDSAGKLRHWRETCEPVLVEDGRLLRSAGTIQEITDIKETELELRKQQAQFAQAHQFAKLGYWSWTCEDDRVSLSPEAIAIFGLNSERSDLLTYQGDLKPLEHPDDRERVDEVGDLLAEKGAHFEIEYRVRPEEGVVRWVHEFGEAILDDRGKLTGHAGIIQDITERKLAEERLRRAHKMQAIGQITTGVAHDFNNLLAVIIGHAQLLQLRLGDPEKLTQEVIQCATHGAELTQKLLSFARQQPHGPEAVDLAALVTEMMGIFERTLGETIEVEVRPAAGLWPVAADPSQFENALLNLAINARDAMPEGGRLIIEMANAQPAEPEMQVELSIADNGIGMTPEVLQQAFEPSFTTKDIGRGSGLGLSMVQGFVKQAGGDISIESEPGRGTTVKLYLPRAEESLEAAESAPEAEEPRGEGETILVVEDEAQIRELIVMLLADLGYQVLDAKDVEGALAILDGTSAIDLILSDAVLPGGRSGPWLLDEAQRRWRVPTLLMSGYSAEVVERDGGLEGRLEFLRKPFRRSDLASKLRSLLDGDAA